MCFSLCFFPLFPPLSFCLPRMVEYSLDLQNINLSAIRTVRVLRPLKAINRVPSENILSLCLYLFMKNCMQCKLSVLSCHYCLYFLCVCAQSCSLCLCVSVSLHKDKCICMKINVLYMCYISGFSVHPHATCSPWGSLNIHLMLNHTGPESQLYPIYKPSTNAASLISP